MRSILKRQPTLEVVVIESAMPTMITAAALAIVAGLAPRLAAAMVGYGLLLAMITVPAWRLPEPVAE